MTNQYCRVLSRIYPKQSFHIVFLFFALTTISCFIFNASAQTPSGNAKILGPDTAIVGQEIEISIELKNPSHVNSYNVDLQYPKVVDYKSVSGANGNPTPNVTPELTEVDTKSRHFTSKLPDGEFFSAGLLFTAKFVTNVAGSHKFTIVEWQVDTGAESNGSAKYVQAITMIEHVLAASRPQETLLLANYPNPFNPETWIPYQLANAKVARSLASEVSYLYFRCGFLPCLSL